MVQSFAFMNTLADNHVLHNKNYDITEIKVSVAVSMVPYNCCSAAWMFLISWKIGNL